MSDALLSLNAGSSSLKFALHAATPGPEGTPAELARGQIERIADRPRLVARPKSGPVHVREWPAPPGFDAILSAALDWCREHLGDATLLAAGHRVVHGGVTHRQPARVTPALLADLEALTPLAPLHQPRSLAPIRALVRLRPDLPQVACFDTAFHATMPEMASRFGLPRALHDEGIRRYGFHGLSYAHVAGRLRRMASEIAGGRVIAAHLGNGASLCAMRDGLSVDTTMGFTAMDGLLMGTRCGALDPGVVLHLIRERGMTPDAVDTLLNRKSGLLGVSGLASDMRTLLDSDAPEAAEAVALFVHRAARECGALTASLGGLDALVFTGGIGTNAAPIRAAICARLAWLGCRIDPAANAAGDAARLDADDSDIAIFALPTDEEAVIAEGTRAVVCGATAQTASAR